ncbi:MAG: M17 family peptidase N-terminal domain-containing protein, partial [Acidimicrobiia bacterium]|nr:M17 family peptidase N-terminal domain-containing protein [Acidimicrobiia bacterium]
MNVTTVRSLTGSAADAVIVGMYPGNRAADGTVAATRLLGAWTRDALEAAGFDGESGATAVLPNPSEDGPRTVVFVGLGSELDVEGLRQAAGYGRRALPAKVRTVATTLHRIDLDGAVGAVLEGIALADYSFDTYKSKADSRPKLTVELVGSVSELESVITAAKVVTDMVAFARDLVNEPPQAKAPLALAERVASVATGHDLQHEIWAGDRLHEEKMAGLLAVGGGAARPPPMVRVDNPPPRAEKHLVLGGEGIVLDYGGV